MNKQELIALYKSFIKEDTRKMATANAQEQYELHLQIQSSKRYLETLCR